MAARRMRGVARAGALVLIGACALAGAASAEGPHPRALLFMLAPLFEESRTTSGLIY